MFDPERHFVEFLKANNLSVTKERRLILHAVYAIDEHFTAEDLLSYLALNNVKISRASVYRTLNLLTQCTLVHKIDFGSGISFYEHVHHRAHHDHMVCTECGKIDEFADSNLERLLTQVCRRAGFLQSGHSLRLYGLCQRCADDRSTEG